MEEPKLTHYQKYKDTIRAYQQRNREQVLANMREYQRKRNAEKQQAKKDLIIQEYLQSLLTKK